MAKLGWIGSVALAAGAAAAAAATQFGLGYGLGIISWTPLAATGPQTSDSVWLAGLAWTTCIATTSTVVGAICADRRSAGEVGAPPPRLGSEAPAPPSAFAHTIWRILLAVSAAVGALLSVALVLVPARAAVRADTSTPQLIAGGYAVIGIVAGILIAICALIARSAATNVVTTTVWLWLLAIASVIDGVIAGRGLGSAPLGIWPFNNGTHALAWSLPAGLSMLAAAFVIGAVVAWAGVRRGDSRVGTSVSGLLGPLLVTVAYDLTAPHLVGVDDSQLSAYEFAPQALVAGLAGSMLVVAFLTSRANMRAAAAEAGTTDFRPPSDAAGSGAGGSAAGTGRVGSGAAVGRARPLGRFRGDRSSSAPAPRTADEITQPLAVPAAATGTAAVAKDAGTVKAPVATTKPSVDPATPSTPSQPSPNPKSDGKRGRR